MYIAISSTHIVDQQRYNNFCQSQVKLKLIFLGPLGNNYNYRKLKYFQDKDDKKFTA